jgi:hypothetical protein
MSNPSNWIALCALLVSLATLAFTLYWNSPIGDVAPLEPAGYAVIRGLVVEQGIGSFPSDHLVLPMQWKNTSGRPTIIQRPELILRKVGGVVDCETELTFTLAGAYPDISTESFSRRYSHNNSFLVEPHSVSLNTLVFHIKSFWEEEGSHFRFDSTDEFRVHIRYVKNSGLGNIAKKVLKSYADGERTELLANSLKMHGSLDNLKPRDDTGRKETDPWWDYWEEMTF